MHCNFPAAKLIYGSFQQKSLQKPLLQLILSVCISHHHGEDGEELLLRDAVVAVEVVHPEGDFGVGKDKLTGKFANW